MKSKIEFVNITKRFGDKVANDSISFSVQKNTIHALLGENGAGKSTLMSILFGLQAPNAGHIEIDGIKVMITSPRKAVQLKISMLPQHFNLIENLTVWENIVLGYERTRFLLDKAKVVTRINEIKDKYHINLNVEKIVSKLPVSDKQKVELLKILWNEADILIMDEPTSILTPNQIVDFLAMLRNLKKFGKTILLITHKLFEIQQVADVCTVIRKGQFVKTVPVQQTTSNQLVELMIGKRISLKLDNIPKKQLAKPRSEVLQLHGVSLASRLYDSTLNDVSFAVAKGEILGIAAIEGNGVSELMKTISGVIKPRKGKVVIEDTDVTHWAIHKRYYPKQPNFLVRLFTKAGTNEHLAYLSNIPEDRHVEGLVLQHNVSKNVILQDLYFYSNRFGVLDTKKIHARTHELVRAYDVRGVGDAKTKVAELSGGNQQKLIVAREIERDSKVLIAFNPTRGLDVGAIRNVYESIIDYRNRGGAVVLYSGELDEIIEVADRIAIMYKGRIVHTVDSKEISKNEIGMYMSQGFAG